MNWSKNKEALKGAQWQIYTKKEHFAELTHLFKDSVFELALLEIEDSIRVAGCGFVKTTQCDGGVILLNGLKVQLQQSLEYKRKILFAPPDTIFGNGTIPNLLALGEREFTCVAFPHLRVHPTILDSLEYAAATKGPFSNRELCKLSLEHAHASWAQAEVGHPHNNSYVGGIAWKRLGDNLISVTHRLPTPYLIHFHPHDFDYWWSVVSFGALDHSWPGDRLIRQERLRVVGSSDACFVCEITDHDKNVPPLVESKKQSGDEYWGDRLHHSVNRLFNVIWRY